MSKAMNFGTTQSIYMLRTPTGASDITIDGLIELAKHCNDDNQTPVVMSIQKLNKATDGGVQNVTGTNEGTIEVFPVGFSYRNVQSTAAVFEGYTFKQVVQPGKDLVINLTDDAGAPIDDGNGHQKQMSDTTGMPAKTYVRWIFDEGSQSGELMEYVSPDMYVEMASMQSAFPFGVSSEFGLPPVPAACNGSITDDKAAKVDNP